MKQLATTTSTPTHQPWAALNEVGGDQWAAAAGCVTAMLNGFEAMRKVQERTTHEAADHHAAAAEKLKNGCSASEIATIHANLIRQDFESATTYLQHIAATSMEMQTRMAAVWSRTINTQTVLESLSSIAGKPR